MLTDTIKIRKATMSDLSDIAAIYERARAFMNDTGNPSQWGSAYPPLSLTVSDIENGELYVAYKDVIEAVFVFTKGKDPTYDYIDGKWLNTQEYRAVHRVASRGAVKGMLAKIMDFCFSECPNIKIDTHRDNAVMQKALLKYGFTRCGIIFLENGEDRIAYQMKK